MATLYYVIGPAAGWSNPSAAQVKAGQLHGGSAATASGSETARTTTGEQIFGSAASGLSANTSYRVAFVWSDGSNDSTVVVSDPFTTATSSYPTVLSRTTGATTTNGTSHSITLPTHAAGDLLVVVFGSDGSATVSTSSTGWTLAGSTVAGTTTCRGTIAWKVAASASETLTLTTSASEQAAWVIYRISGGGYVEVGAQNNDGSLATTNPPAVTASHGSDGNLWIAAQVRDGSLSSPSTTPANYSQLQHIAGSGGANVTVNSMERELVAASEDPGTFGGQGSVAGIAFTLCVRPTAYPYVRGAPTTSTGSPVTSLSVTLPAHVAGDTLVVLVSAGASPSIDTGSSSAGWQASSVITNSATRSAVFYLPSAANGSTTLTLSLSSARIAAIAYAIGGAGAVTLASATGSSTSADPPSIAQPTNPKALYLATYAGASGSAVPTVSAFPSGYLGGTTADATGAANARVASAQLASQSAQDPGAFSLSGTITWVAWTVAVEQVAVSAGTANHTVEDFTTSATAVVRVQGAASQDIPAFEQTATGSVQGVTTGTADQTIPAFEQTASGAVRAAGSASQDVPAFTQSAAGAVRVLGTADQTIPDFGQSASGVLGNTITGTADQTIPAFSQDAVGTVRVSGTASHTLDAFSQSAAGSVTIAGSASQTIPDFGQVATGVQGEVSVGTANQTIPAFTQSAAGSVRAAASASQDVPAFTQVVQAAARVVAQAAQQVEAFLSSAEADVIVAGQAVQQVLAFAQSASGTVSDGAPVPDLPASIVFYLPTDGVSLSMPVDNVDFALPTDGVSMELNE